MSAKTERPQDSEAVRSLLLPYEQMGQRTLVYLPQEGILQFSQRTCDAFGLRPEWRSVPDSLVPIVHPDDVDALLDLYAKASAGAELASADIRHATGEVCLRVTLRTVERDDDGNATLVIGIVEDVSAKERNRMLSERLRAVVGPDGSLDDEVSAARNRIAEAIGGLYFAVYHISLEDGSYVCFRERLRSVLSQIGSRGDAVAAFAAYIDSHVTPEDRETVRAFCDLSTLADRLDDCETLDLTYRRTDGSWVLARFITASRDRDGRVTSVAYVVQDVTAEHDHAQQESEALYAATHDLATGALSRSLLESVLTSETAGATSSGLLAVQVDDLRGIAKRHGSEAADRTVALVAKELMHAFREGDETFRVGEGQFAVILRGCDDAFWDALCQRISHINATLAADLPQAPSATLSAGVCFSKDGPNRRMYEAAIEGASITTRNGGAGCTLMSTSKDALDYWRDCEASGLAPQALEGANSGTGVVEESIDGSVPIRLVCGATLRSLYDFEPAASPERCWELWLAGLDPSYRDTIDEARQRMREGDGVECTFLWHHPTVGPILMRMTGSARRQGDVWSYSGIHHSLRDMRIVERASDWRLVIQAQSSVYFSSVYVNLVDQTFTHTADMGDAKVGYDQPEVMARFAKSVDAYVAKTERDRIGAFLDLDTLDARIGASPYIDCEFLSSTALGWCRARWVPVRRNPEGTLTHALFLVTSIDAVKQAEMDRDREVARLMRIHYDAAETLTKTHIVGISLIDRATGKNESWETGEKILQPKDLTIREFTERLANHVPEGERAALLAALDVGTIIARVGSDGSYEVPVTLDVEGSPRYFEYHFSPYPDDPTRIFEVIEDVTAIREGEGRSIQDLFDNVPGGVATYEWDGHEFECLHLSESYARICSTAISYDEDGAERIDREHVHPDDRAGFQAAIDRMIAGTNEIHHEYRIWNSVTSRYMWTQVDGVLRWLADGHALLYAIYSNIDDRVRAQTELEKTSASLETALEASNQVGYALDPVTHAATCFTPTNVLGLPRHTDDFLATVRDLGRIHPEDAYRLSDAIWRMEGGARNAQCDVRLRTGADYRWQSFLFNACHDEAVGHDIVIVLITDVELRVKAEQAARSRIDSVLGATDSVMSVVSSNLTTNRVTEVRVVDEDLPAFSPVMTYDEAVSALAPGFAIEGVAQEFTSTFGREALLERFAAGKRQVRVEGLYHVGANRTEWIEVVAELVENPVTGDVEGIGYTRAISRTRFSTLLLDEALNADYPMAAVLVAGGDEYYNFDRNLNALCEHRLDFWGSFESGVAGVCGPEEARRGCAQITRESVLAQIAKGDRPEYAFDVTRNGSSARYVLRFTLIDERRGLILAALRSVVDKGMYERLRYEARHDRVTGLYNRFGLFERCRQILDAHPGKRFSLSRLDVRRFRLYNSFFGEQAGDELLRTMAKGIADFCGTGDDIAYGRIEGDVFGILMPTDQNTYDHGSEFLRTEATALSDTFLLEPSLGVYDIADRSLSIEAMLARATTASRETRADGTTVVRRYDEAMDQRLAEELEITGDMQRALDDGQFVVYLQPKFGFKSGKVTGSEALVRWMHPERGMISPGRFIPVFETNGFIAKLDRYMWEHVCRVIRSWIDRGIPVLPVSVNVSRVSASNPQTVPFLKSLVERYGIAPSLMELELTESAYIDDPTGIKNQLEDLREYGFSILMDDFGSGYSSLNTLRELPVDIVKLDRLFLSEACEDARGRTVLTAMVAMVHELGLPMVCEGVEDESQASYLRSLGCEYVQGFLYARPMPVGEYEGLIGGE